MTSTIIIYFDGKMLITVEGVPTHIDQNQLLSAYAEKYGFERHRLTWAWIPESIPFSALEIK